MGDRMIVKGLDGKDHKLILRNKQERASCSSYHEKCRELLKQIYPLDTIIEELTIPGGSSSMYLDFFLPLRKLAIEIQGEQHYSFNTYFFKSKLDYAKAIGRDKKKKEFCTINNFTFLELKYDRQSEWESIIRR